MSNYNQDDFFSKLIEDMDNWDDDDLMLLDAEDGAVSAPSASRAGQTAPEQATTYEYTPAGESGQAPSREKKGAPVALIVILILLIAIVGGALVALKMTDGDLTQLMFWKSESIVVSNSGSTQEDAEEATQAEEAEAEEEEVLAEEEEIIDSEQAEVEEEEAEEEAVTVSLTGLALLDLWGEDFTPNLVGVNNVGGAQADISNGQLDYTAATYLEQFISAARSAGYNTICTINGKYVAAGANATQEELEHATGLAVDLIDVENQVPAALESDASMAEEIAWWAEHAAEYGFVLRYPADKEDVTGQAYCCYHFVYVTVSVAQEMAENNWCLEEYLENTD